MSPADSRFGPRFLSDLQGEARRHTGAKTVADFESRAYIPILAAGILNPAGPTLTVFSISKPDKDGEVWLCEHMLNPFQTTFHRMLRMNRDLLELSPEGRPTTGVDEALQSFARIHLAGDQSFTPGTFHTYCAAVKPSTTEAVLLSWMEGSDNTVKDLQDLTDPKLRRNFAKRASFERIQQRIADKRKTTQADAVKLLRAALEPAQQAAEREGILEGWDIAQARAPGLRVVTTSSEIKELFLMVTGIHSGQAKSLVTDKVTSGSSAQQPVQSEPDRILSGRGLEANKPKTTDHHRPQLVERDFAAGSWATYWVSLHRQHGKAGGYQRPTDGLEAWGQFTDGDSIQKSARLGDWPAIARRLQGKKFSMGQLAVRHANLTFEGRPGVTFLFKGQQGGSQLAHRTMGIFSRHRLGGAMADLVEGGNWVSLTYIFSPHWYAAAGDRSFDADWPTREKSGADEVDGRRIWCNGMQHAINEALAELPEGCVDALYFDSYAANDRLELLTDQQLKTLLKTKPDGLAKVLSLPYPPAPGLWDALFG